MKVDSLETLDDFQGWESYNSDEDFFLIDTEEVETADDLKPDEEETAEDIEDEEETEVENTEVEEEEDDEDEEESETVKKENHKKKKKEQDLFSIDDEDESEEEEEEEANLENNESINRQTLEYLKEKGYFEFEDDESYDDLTGEDLDHFIEDKFDQTVEKKVSELFSELPDVVKQMNTYVIQGGDPMQFISYINQMDSSNLTADTKEQQTYIVKNYLKSQGYKDDYIERQIEFLDKSGDLQSVAQKQIDDLQKANQEKQESLIRQQKEAEENRKKMLRDNKRKIDQFAKENNNIGDIGLSRKDKKELGSYMYDQAYKLQNGNLITPMQKELFYDLPKNETAMIQLAVILRNRNEDGTFNFDNIKKEVETKITKKIKQDVRRSKNIVPNDSSQKRKYSKKSLADFFD